MPYELESHTGPLSTVIEAYNKRDQGGWVLVQFAVVPAEPSAAGYPLDDTYVSVWWKEATRGRGRPSPRPSAPMPAPLPPTHPEARARTRG